MAMSESLLSCHPTPSPTCAGVCISVANCFAQGVDSGPVQFMAASLRVPRGASGREDPNAAASTAPCSLGYRTQLRCHLNRRAMNGALVRSMRQ
eukprot:4217984-Pyramimonas_sp.AAC.1